MSDPNSNNANSNHLPPGQDSLPSRDISAASSAMPDGSSLDHALLESLFYNEMMMLDDSSALISSITGAAVASPPPPDLYSASGSNGRQPVDPHTYAEKSLLMDFGVSNDPIPHITNHHPSNQQQQQQQQQQQHQAWAEQQQQQLPPQEHPARSRQPKKSPSKSSPRQTKQQTAKKAAAPIAPQQQPLAPSYSHPPLPTMASAPVAAHPQHHAAAYGAAPPPLHSHHPHPHAQYPPPYAPLPTSHHPPTAVATTTSTANTAGSPMAALISKTTPPQQQQQHAHPPKQQLVSQFATLASRLGITLPPHLLQSLGDVTNPADVAMEISRAAEAQALAPHAAHSPHAPPAYHPAPQNYAAPPPPPHHAQHPHHAAYHPHYPYAHHHPHHHVYHQYPHYSQPPPPPHPYSTMHHPAAPPPPPLPAPPPPPTSVATTATPAPPTDNRPALTYSNGIKHALQPPPPPPPPPLPPAPVETISSSPAPAPAPAPTPHMVVELRKTAEDAIAAVTKKRSYAEQQLQLQQNSSHAADESADDDHHGAKDARATYGKRKKKPRLSDCESRLAQLQSENELLKRHLDNITNKTHKFEQERSMVEDNMKHMMMTSGVPDEELEKVILEYADMYSDYGKRRHEELSFHLEQLQKLVNPTNFTKMGLWAVARANRKATGKQNPIIGILQKELDINPQQVRKILDQQQKIRDLCDNLHACLVLLQKLKDLCEQKNKIFSDRLNKTREILTPRQVMKLIMFVKQHTDVLGELCPGWTSEQIVKAKKAKAVATLSSVAAAVEAESSAVRSSGETKLPAATVSSDVVPIAVASSHSVPMDTAVKSIPIVLGASRNIKPEEATAKVPSAPVAHSSTIAPLPVLVPNGTGPSAVEGGTATTGCTPLVPNTEGGTPSQAGSSVNTATAATTLSIQPLVK